MVQTLAATFLQCIIIGTSALGCLERPRGYIRAADSMSNSCYKGCWPAPSMIRMGDLARGACDPCHAMSHVHLERTDTAKMQAWRGTLVHAVSLDEIELLEDHVLIVGTGNGTGKILAICHGDKEEPVLQQHGLTQADVHQLQAGIESIAGRLRACSLCSSRLI